MELNIRIAGAAGQGLQTAADLLGRAITRSGHRAYLYNDAESRIRGGLNFCHLRCGRELRQGVKKSIDLLVALTPEAVSTFSGQLSEQGLMVCQEDCSGPLAAPFSLRKLSEQAGSIKTLGMIAAAAVGTLLGIDRQILTDLARERFSGDEKLIALNLRAIALGAEAAAGTERGQHLRLPPGETDSRRLWLAGAEAIALGAVAGGVRFVAGYPMSPATGILTSLAEWAVPAGLVVEQAEDELAAINMVAGASYAGARSMTATSGGGFCLMTEGVSLLGMIEAPAVIVLAQRPGPATGLPTRHAQGDLRLVLHAGHGFFPRIIFAPRNIAEGFELTARAFDLAERYQVPVFVLTDQLLQESQASLEPPALDHLPRKRHLLTKDDLGREPHYQRFALTDSGISPLAAPGTSRHVVVVDSDEHDAEGHLTESATVAGQMAEKRLRKAATIEEALAFQPEVTGEVDGEALVVSWGSTYETLREARALLADRGARFASLHLSQLWPLPARALENLLARAKKVVVLESSVGAELSGLLAQVALRKPEETIRRLDGRSHSVDELAAALLEALR